MLHYWDSADVTERRSYLVPGSPYCYSPMSVFGLKPAYWQTTGCILGRLVCVVSYIRRETNTRTQAFGAIYMSGRIRNQPDFCESFHKALLCWCVGRTSTRSCLLLQRSPKYIWLFFVCMCVCVCFGTSLPSCCEANGWLRVFCLTTASVHGSSLFTNETRKAEKESVVLRLVKSSS